MTASHLTTAAALPVASLIRFAKTSQVITATRLAAPAGDPLQPVLPLDFSGLLPAAPGILGGHRVLAVGAVIETARTARLGYPVPGFSTTLSIA
ncbi:hypothetical protein [Nocardioides pakistanensis]